MPRDNLVGSSRRCWSAEVCLSRSSQNHRIERPLCLENPRPEGAEYSLTENASSPFHAEPEHRVYHQKSVPRQLNSLHSHGCLMAFVDTEDRLIAVLH